MIKVNILKGEIKISGHADYADYGKDIVCASVSAIVTTSVNAIIRFDKDAISYKENDGLDIKILKNTDSVKKLIDNMVDLLSELQNDYPKNIIINREV